MFTFAHLSDPHLGPLPEPRLRELMSKRMLGYLNWRLNRGRGAMRPAVLDALVADMHAHKPDHVCVTGDIVNIALDAELVAAKVWLATLGPPDAVSVVPGNHDAYIRTSLKQSSEAWAAYLSGDGAEPGGFPYVRRRGPVAFVGVSSARATGPFMATGTFDVSQSLRLAQTLAHLGHEGLFRVVMIHHPPVRGATPWAARLIGAERFRRVVREAGAELVLHGHSHRASTVMIAGPDGDVPVIGVPSASSTPRPGKRGAGWNRFTVEGGPGAWQLTHEERGFPRDDGEAVEIARHRIALTGTAPRPAADRP
jgi:3',5'-cyclic AMP phosphodiesterase CpdA